MTGNRNYFGDISLAATGFVNFGDGARSQIKGDYKTGWFRAS